MRQISNKYTSELIALGKKLGLDKKDIGQLLNDIPLRNEQPSFALGPDHYPCSYYGTISIKDFKN